MTHWSDKLIELGACPEAVEWAKTQPSLAAAWRNCNRGDWMLWLLSRLCAGGAWSDERKPIVACAAECASAAEKYVNQDSMLAWMWCIDACERWSRGEADRDEVEAARYASAAAASAAAAYAYAAYAYAATAAADAAAAVSAAAADAAAAAAYASADARASALALSAEIVRRHFSAAPTLEVLEGLFTFKEDGTCES